MTNTENKQLQKNSLPSPEIIEKVIMSGDLSGLTSEQRLAYYKSVCETLHLNPLTKPFDYIVLDQKLVLYATKDCAAQLRKRNKISITITSREQQETIYIVTAKASLRTVSSTEPREDESLGAVSIITKDGQQLKGTALGNAVMKAETKAKRRVTLSICGLGMLDEGEVEDYGEPAPSTIPAAIVERNVREAAAHATGEGSGDHFIRTGEVLPVGSTNEFGPLTITQDNYKELVSHVGKAQGNMLGRKVGELHANVIEWMYNNWREKLGPSASEQDMRLKKAIEFAFHSKDDLPRHTGEQETPEEKASRQACITDLRQRIEGLVLTEEQACKYLHQFGLFGQGWTSFNDAPTGLLLHLCTPAGWKTFKELLDKEVKPKVVEPLPKKKGRKRAARKL